MYCWNCPFDGFSMMTVMLSLFCAPSKLQVVTGDRQRGRCCEEARLEFAGIDGVSASKTVDRRFGKAHTL